MGSLDVASYAPIARGARADGDRVGRLRHAAARARSDQRRQRVGGGARRRRRADRADRARQRVAGDRRGGVAGGPGRRSSASSCRTWSGCSSAPITGSCCRRRRCSARAFLIGCDLVARTIIAPLELPVGIVTAIIGGPVFLMAAVPPRLTARSRRARAFVGTADAVLDATPSRAGVDRPRHADDAPRRIVSLVPATTEMLFAMGAGDRIVGVSNYDRFPPEVERLPRSAACSIRTSSGSCRSSPTWSSSTTRRPI